MPIAVNPQETGLSIGTDGTASTNLGIRGRIKLVTFANPGNLVNEGANPLSSTAPGGPPASTGGSNPAPWSARTSAPYLEMTGLMDVNRSYALVTIMIPRMDELRLGHLQTRQRGLR